MTTTLAEIKLMRHKKRSEKLRWSHAPRNDQWRQSHGIPASADTTILKNRRESLAADLKAKQKQEPRIVRRQKRLAELAERRERVAELKKSLDEQLFPKLAVAEAKEVQAA